MKKLPEGELLEALRQELLHWNEGVISMTRMFEEVFPPLSLDQSLLDLLGQVKVEKVTSNRAKKFS